MENVTCFLVEEMEVITMLHSIISFNDENGVLIDFYRLKQKKPSTVLKKIYQAFTDFENLYLNQEVKNRCKNVTIHYTHYESTEENMTYSCSFDEFMENLKAYRNA